MQDAEIKVTVYFVVRSGKCDLVTSSKSQANGFVDTFNKLRQKDCPEAVLLEKIISI
ncbi:MAG: hypothetical protein V4719_02925 [Planctomycetota bacterium]